MIGRERAYLVLEDGEVFEGVAVGAKGLAVGELVFNTGVVGYQEIITDPSYYGQIIIFTQPHIGNTGVNEDDAESSDIQAAGLIMRETPTKASSWRSEMQFEEYLIGHGKVGIAEIDTRALTKKIVAGGCMRASICSDPELFSSMEHLRGYAADYSEILREDLSEKVSTKNLYSYAKKKQINSHSISRSPFKVVVYDLGVKRSILNLLVQAGCEVQVVPVRTPSESIILMEPNFILLSNGPGNPSVCELATRTIRELVFSDIPIVAICLGFQILMKAVGAKLSKLEFGHHGINHPIKDLESGRVFITSQNHNYVVNEESLPHDFVITHRSLFDQSVQGVRHKYKHIICFQGHPEAGPGPSELSYIFLDMISSVIHKGDFAYA